MKLRWLILFLFIFSCGYRPILVENKNNFKFNDVKLLGDKQTSELILDNLETLRDTNSANKIEINSFLKSSISSKNKKGDPEIFTLNINSDVTLIKKGKTLKANFSDSITYKNQESKFKLKKYEDKLKSDLISKVSEDITLFLLSTD